MVRHTSASPREAKSTLRDKQSSNIKPHHIDADLKRRARLLLTNSSIPGQTRNMIRYALEIRDRHLAQLVRRVENGEMTIDHVYLE